MSSKLPESTRLTYARQLADEAKTLVPGMERLSAIAEELRADDLYRLLGFDTWERFCSDYLGVSKRTANRWIASPKPKSITAGQSVAAGQNVPVVESDALNSAAKQSEGKNGTGSPPHSAPGDSAARPGSPSGQSSEGVAQTGETPAEPCKQTPSGPPSGGAGIQPSPRPTGEPTSPLSAPPGPIGIPWSPITPETVALFEDRLRDQRLAGNIHPNVFASMVEHLLADRRRQDPDASVDVDAIGLRWLQSKNTREVRAIGDPWGPAIRSEVRRWAEAFGAPPVPAEKPQRRQGTITRPADRIKGPRPYDPVTLTIPVPSVGRKGHADDCSCLSCKAPKAVAK